MGGEVLYFIGKFFQAIKEWFISVLLKLPPNRKNYGKCPNSFYETSKSLDIIPPQKIQNKPTSLMNTDVVIFNKILANHIQLIIKQTIYHGQVQLMPGTQGWFNMRKIITMILHVTRSEELKINMIIQIALKNTDNQACREFWRFTYITSNTGFAEKDTTPGEQSDIWRRLTKI